MERLAAVSILYDTLDVLAKLNIDLCSGDSNALIANRRAMADELAAAVANVEAAIMSLQENVARTSGPAASEPS